MNNISTLSINLLLEQVYLESHIHMMFENILKEENSEIDPKSKSIFKQVINDLKLNADFMLTFGVGISAFIGPVSELLSNKGLHITPYDVTLLVIVSFYILLSKSDNDIKKLMDRLRERKLDKEVKSVVKFINGTVGFFKIVGKKIGTVVTSLTDILGFTFMSVPVLNMLKDFAAEKGFNIDNIYQLFGGLALSIGSYYIKNLLKKNLKEQEEDELEWARKALSRPITEINGSELLEFLNISFKDSRSEAGDYRVEILDNGVGIRDNTGLYFDLPLYEFNYYNIMSLLEEKISDMEGKEYMENVLQEYIHLYDTLQKLNV